MEVPHKIIIKLPYDPALPPLGVHPKGTKSAYHRYTFTAMLIIALFTVAQLWN
jgi:hypothetical protein